MYNMAINFISNAINNIAGVNRENAGEIVQSKEAMDASRLTKLLSLNELKNLVVGDTLSGTLLNQDGNKISLLLNDGMTLNTTMDGDVNIAMGKQLSFEVRSNHNGQLTLRPMFTNLSNSNTITNALNEAGIEVSQTTIEMVDTLMRNNMPIDKDMLHLINRELTLYPDADVEDLVMLHKMNIPVTDSNVKQMHLYMNNNQWLFENIESGAKELTSLILESYSENGIDGEFLNQLSTALRPQSEELQISPKNYNPENIKEEIALNMDKADLLNMEKQGNENINNSSIQNTTLSDINKFNVFDKIATMSRDEFLSDNVKRQISSSLNELLKDNFLMEPKSFEDERYLTKHYENINRISEQLSNLLNNTGKGESDFAKTVSNIRENTSFINHINELYNYIQLPLKMNNAQANGDLYIYAKKRGRRLNNENESLTALLHLSMNYLGNMDIMLTLNKGQKLSTKFTLEKEEMIDFLEAHMEELNQRLIKKGYDIEASKVGKPDEERENPIEKITKEDGDSRKILLSTQSFDARA